MLRLTIALLVALAVNETAEGADEVHARHASYRGWHRTVVILPAGLPRRHYDFRTTISYGEPTADRVSVVPLDGEPPYLPTYVRGPYYGGPYVPYWDRLPDACGVYGDC